MVSSLAMTPLQGISLINPDILKSQAKNNQGGAANASSAFASQIPDGATSVYFDPNSRYGKN